MKISLQWLRDWIEHDFAAEQLADQLTMAGLEVSSITPIAPAFSGVVIGEVLEVIQHPDAERLHICKVKVDAKEPLSIVCGAANVRAGLKVPVAVIGAILPTDFKIKKAKLRGVESHGMICSAKELQLSEESQGIMELLENVPVGMDFSEYLKLNDQVLEVELTPNRGDCLSIMGMAREICAINNLPLKTPFLAERKSETNGEGCISVEVLAQEACPHYAGRMIKGINIKSQTPLWLKERLRRSSLQSINPVVDVANYVMLELGQPLHAFDVAKIDGSKIVVRYAQDSEKLVALGGTELNLSANTNNLVIADQNKAIALAGVIGGLDSAVSETTIDVFLESACFTPEKIGVCARSFGLQTDAAYRFERGVDPELQIFAIERATQLLLEIVGGEASEIVEVKNENFYPKRHAIEFKHNYLKKLLGYELEQQEIERILTSLSIQLRKNDEGWVCQAPTYRFDINIAEDLVEEVARLYGYDRLPEKEITASLNFIKKTEQSLADKKRQVGELVAAKGYSEAITYSFVDPKIQELLNPDRVALTLAKPISPEMSVMRTNLWTGLVKALQYNQNRSPRNLKHFNIIRLFEIGICFLPNADKIKNLVQNTMFAGVAMGHYPLQWAEKPRPIDFFDIKDDVLYVLCNMGYSKDKVIFKTKDHPALHPEQCASLEVCGREIGYVGRMHPSIQQSLDLILPVYLFEIDLSSLLLLPQHELKEISKFPAVERDLAFLVDNRIVWRQIEEKIREVGGELLQDVQSFDIYSSSKDMEVNKKSVAVRLYFQHLMRMLIDDEVNESIKRITLALERDLKATLRG